MRGWKPRKQPIWLSWINGINYDNMDDNQQEYLNDLVEYLLNWLSTHILKMDKRIPTK